MKNQFYQEFDTEAFEQGARPADYRSPFQIDRDRIIYSSSFRRLQSKTQVFVAGQYDFYRTRLTHTIEVAQVGRSLCQWLLHSSAFLSEDFFVDPDLVEAACLAHDLGHPPFGHTGEATLHAVCAEYGGFEGNAQSLRLLTKTLYQGERGMAPTRALADAILKYKTTYLQWQVSTGKLPQRHFLYDDQEDILQWVHGGTSFLAEHTPGKIRNSLSSIECQIMDWADDTAYSLNDIVDGVAAKFLSVESIQRWAEGKTLDKEETIWVEELIAMICQNRVEGRLGRKIGKFIQAVSLQRVEGFLAAKSSRYQFCLSVEELVLKECALYKKIARDLIFRAHKLQQLDRKADRFLRCLWQELWQEYHPDGKKKFQLVPAEWEAKIMQSEGDAMRARWIADWLGGMSDASALRAYQSLFDPTFGSISDFSSI